MSIKWRILKSMTNLDIAQHLARGQRRYPEKHGRKRREIEQAATDRIAFLKRMRKGGHEEFAHARPMGPSESEHQASRFYRTT